VLERVYPDASKHTIKNWAAQISVHVLYMKPGDWFVMPLKHKPAIAVGEVTSPYRFDPNAKPLFHHYREVRWLDKAVLRSRFDQDLLYSFGAFMTFCEISRNDAEARIRAMLSKGKAVTSTHASEIPDETQSVVDIEVSARDQLAKTIDRKFKGHGLERLVEAILKAQGYTTYRSPEGSDGGKDILAAGGNLGFGSPKICVQVKSSDSPVDMPTLNQLIGTMQQVKAEHGLLVAWGGFKSSVERERGRQFFGVRLWDQNDLIAQIQQYYDKLDDEIKAELPLKRIWVVAAEAE
jgi:restriction system protein